jgi:hypothetical protein
MVGFPYIWYWTIVKFFSRIGTFSASDLQQVCGFRRELRFPPPINVPPTYNWNIGESRVKHHNSNPQSLWNCFDDVAFFFYFNNISVVVNFLFEGNWRPNIILSQLADKIYSFIENTLSQTGMDLQLPMQSEPITTKVVNSDPAHGEVYSIQHYVIKFVSDLRWSVVFPGSSGFLHQ